jgi:tetratricopeptide (TPR) repeat protein
MAKAKFILSAVYVLFYTNITYPQDTTLIEQFKPSSRAVGFGGSLVVQARDPSAIFWNPALLTGLHDRSLLISVNEPFNFDFVGFTQFIPLFGTLGVAISRVAIPGQSVDKGYIAWARKITRRVSFGTTVSLQKHGDDWFADGSIGLFIGNPQVGTLDYRWRNYRKSRFLDRWNLGVAVKNLPLSDKLFEPSAQFGMSYLFPLGFLFNSAYHINKEENTPHFGAGFEFNSSVTVFSGIEDLDVEKWGIGMSYTHDNFVFNFTYSRELDRILFTLSARISPAAAVLAAPYYQRASNNFKNKKYKLAAKLYRQYLSYEVHASESDTAYHRVRLLAKKIARDKRMVDSLYTVTSRLMTQGEPQYLRAAVILRKILEIEPENLKAKTKLVTLKPHVDKFVKRSLADGVYEFRMENYFRAKGAFNRVLLFEEDNIAAQKYVARIDTILNELAEEYFYRGVGYFRQKNYKWAKEEFIRAIKYNSSHKEASSYLARTYEKIDKTKQLMSALIKEGQALEKQGRYSDAVNKYLEILKIDEENEFAKSRISALRPKINRFVTKKYNEGLRYLRAANYSKAVDAFNTVLSIDPDHSDARRQLRQLRNKKKQKVSTLLAQAEEAFQKQEWRAALELYSQVLQFEPRNTKATSGKGEAEKKLEIDGLLQKGREHFNKGNYKEAENIFLRILSLDPNHRVANVELDATKNKIDELVERYFSSGINLYTLDRYQEAIAMWDKALNLKPDHKGSLDYKKQALDRLEALKKLK